MSAGLSIWFYEIASGMMAVVRVNRDCGTVNKFIVNRCLSVCPWTNRLNTLDILHSVGRSSLGFICAYLRGNMGAKIKIPVIIDLLNFRDSRSLQSHN